MKGKVTPLKIKISNNKAPVVIKPFHHFPNISRKLSFGGVMQIMTVQTMTRPYWMTAEYRWSWYLEPSAK